MHISKIVNHQLKFAHVGGLQPKNSDASFLAHLKPASKNLPFVHFQVFEPDCYSENNLEPVPSAYPGSPNHMVPELFKCSFRTSFQCIPGLHGSALMWNRDGTTDDQTDKEGFLQFFVADALLKAADDVIIDAVVTP